MEKKKYILLFEKYIRNEASAEEELLLLSMLRHDNDIDLFLENQIKNSDQKLDKETEQRMYEHIRSGKAQGKKRLFTTVPLRKAMQWAAMIALPMMSALLVYFLTSDPIAGDNVTVQAPKGEKANITLADGSLVWINSGSSLTYNNAFNQKERKVFLEGEAYFEVAKDPKRPFIVHTRDMDIEALGTAFNVRAYPEENNASTVLLEGKIKINAQGQQRILTENQRAIIDKTVHTFSTDKVFAVDFVQWKDGNLYFENSSFDEIALTLSRVFNVEIQFASERLRSMRFSGTLGNSSIRNALDILSLTSSMQYEMNGTVIELYYKE
ncbi:MAG: FecR domain-containing protein [Porphyromonadaceae bacterium]|nr:FecR domain-containing protein [Porphyromonadaceae bacterium]